MTNARPHDLSACEPHYVYRVFDAQDRLLYVGCTIDPEARMAVHKSFGNPNPASAAIAMHGARHEVVEYPTYDEARAAETAAIYAEAPHFNFAHNGRRFRGTAANRVELLPTYEPAPVEVNQRLLDVLAKFTSHDSHSVSALGRGGCGDKASRGRLLRVPGSST